MTRPKPHGQLVADLRAWNSHFSLSPDEVSGIVLDHKGIVVKLQYSPCPHGAIGTLITIPIVFYCEKTEINALQK